MTGDTKTAVEAKIGRMFADSVSYTVVIPSWFTPDGELWAPNTTVKIEAPGAMIYSSFEFLIRKVIYSRTAERETVTLTLVIPGVFTGLIPENLPWDE